MNMIWHSRVKTATWSALFSGTILWYLMQNQQCPLSLWERARVRGFVPWYAAPLTPRLLSGEKALWALPACVVVIEADVLLDCGVGITPAVFIDEIGQ
jgi:hypothetical protein